MGNPKKSTLKLICDGNRPLKLFKIEGTKEVLAEMYFQRIVHNRRCWYKNPTHHYYIVQQLKGSTSRILSSEFPEIKRRVPSLWTRSYYCETIGHISEETVQSYIEDQKKY